MFVPKPTKSTPWRTPSEFAQANCMKCAAGWTRRSKQGTYLVVCLLDRDPVLPDMTACDRFERREEPV
jgi:hypothetical protein